MADVAGADPNGTMFPPSEQREPLFGVREVSSSVLEAYARLWQFETWLRRLVYVQLRALDGDAWASKMKAGRAHQSKENDKRLTHMPTPEDDVLSFAQLSDLVRVIAEHWQYFEAYLPPKTIWDAKLEEVSAIRYRVAHFRKMHRDDVARLRQFLRDIDRGFWRFCTGYNDRRSVVPQSDDPVVSHFLPLDRFDYRQILRETKSLHASVVHLCLDRMSTTLRLTIPSCLGEGIVKTMIQSFCDAALYATRPGSLAMSEAAVQAYADSQPELVLGPENPLTFLDPGMECAFFEA